MVKKGWKKIIATILAGAMIISDVIIYQGTDYVQATEGGTSQEETGGETGEEEIIDETIEGPHISKLFSDVLLMQYLQKEVDLNDNGHLSRIELLTVRKLNIAGMEIKTLDGIENFPNLEELNCSNNLISSLDLSNNKKLVKLYCNGNRLVQLNLANNIELQVLECSDNMIWELNIENCGKLKELSCRNNLVEKIAIEYASALTLLDCGGNPNLSALNTISNGELKTLKCEGGIITSLNLRYNTKLETVNCENNRLSELDLGEGKVMIYLDCSDNQLEKLDVSKLERLQTIDCSNNQIQKLEVKRSTALNSLDCRDNKIQELDVINNSRLTDLACSGNELVYMDITKNAALKSFLCDNNERIIETTVFDLKELEGMDISKMSQISNAVVEDGLLRFINTSLPATYSYKVNDKKSITFAISTTGTFKSMATVNVEQIPVQTYEGVEIIPEIIATYGNVALEEGKDYITTFSNNIKAGTATVTMTGVGEYDGTIVKNFKIEPVDIGNTEIAAIETQVYTGTAIVPKLKISYKDVEAVYGSDYTANYSNNYSIGEGKIEIIGKGNFSGTLNKYFTIEAKHIGRAALKTIDSQVYTGTAITPQVILEDGANTLSEGTDYTYTYENNINAGTACINIVGIGNYGKESQETFIIEPKAINNLQVDDIPDAYFNGNEKRPGVSVYDGDIGSALIEKEDYTISYENNTAAGTATVIIQGIGNYKGQIEKQFQIKLRSQEHVLVENIEEQEYTAREIRPEIIVKDGQKLLQEGTDYSLAFTGNVEVGTATVEVILQGNYEGILTTQFQVVPRSMGNVDVSKVGTCYYTGMEIKPQVQLKHDNSILEQDKDYTVSYEENIEIGKGKIILTGYGSYSGTKVVEFDIVSRPMETVEILCEETRVYDGTEHMPVPVISYGEYILKENLDYQLAYSDNVNVGNGVINVKGIGNFSGQKKALFAIEPKEIKGWKYEKISPQIYTGEEIIPEIKVFDGETEMLPGKDFDYTVTDNVTAGKAMVTITGKGNYTGSQEMDFTIQPKDIKWAQVGAIQEQIYTGLQLTPEVKVMDFERELELDKDYTIKYDNNIQKGKGQVILTGAGNYAGSQTVDFEITGATLADAQLKVRAAALYTGKRVAPKVQVYLGDKKLKLNKDYIVIYADNKAVGKAKATVEGIGNYKDKKEITFDIIPRTAGVKKLSTEKSRITVTWTKRNEASGYIIEYARDKKFTKEPVQKEIKNGKKTSLQIKKLKKGKRYYVRVRSYKKVKGQLYYGKYSNVKSIKVK